jgi:hypothetical protein
VCIIGNHANWLLHESSEALKTADFSCFVWSSTVMQLVSTTCLRLSACKTVGDNRDIIKLFVYVIALLLVLDGNNSVLPRLMTHDASVDLVTGTSQMHGSKPSSRSSYVHHLESACLSRSIFVVVFSDACFLCGG